MVNNSGKIPFTDAATINKFTIRYIDSRCTELNGNLVNCGSDFMDPNGVQYSWANLGSREKITAGDVDYKIYYKTYAACNDEGDGVVERSGQREFALLMKLEGGKISCNDNR